MQVTPLLNATKRGADRASEQLRTSVHHPLRQLSDAAWHCFAAATEAIGRDLVSIARRTLSTLTIVAIGLLIAAMAGQSCGQDFPGDFSNTLVRRQADNTVIARDLVEQLRQVNDAQTRVRLLRSVVTLPQVPELTAQIRDLLRDEIETADERLLVGLSYAVGYFPSLHDGLLGKTEDAVLLDQIRVGLARTMKDFARARQLCSAIGSPRLRRLTLDALVYRAPNLSTMISLLEARLALKSDTEAGYSYSSLVALRKHAAESPDTICDFLQRLVPADESIYPYTFLAASASKTDRDAAQQYMDAAWSRLDQTSAPFKHAALLLTRDYRDVDRDTWIAKFDTYVLPALRDAKTHIGPLSDLIRFDMQLLIDRTRQSCVHPARRYERVLPHVVARAFSREPATVLRWLEATDSPLRDACVVAIAEYGLPERLREPASQPQLARICDLAVAISADEQRLAALAGLATSLHRLRIPIPQQALARGRMLLDEHVDFASIEIARFDATEGFWLRPAQQQRLFFDAQLDKFQKAPEYQDQYGYANLPHYIMDSDLARDQQVALLRRMSEIAGGHANRYVQAKIASAAAQVDAPWAVRTMWSILPDDRGRAGKRRYIDWIPPPDDAGDAIQWLKMSIQQLAAEQQAPLEVKLTIALHEHAAAAPPQDRDALRFAVCQALKRGHRDEAFGLSKQIGSPDLRVQALSALLARQPAN